MARLPNSRHQLLHGDPDHAAAACLDHCQWSSSCTQRRRNANAEPWVRLVVARGPVALLTLGVVVEERRVLIAAMSMPHPVTGAVLLRASFRAGLWPWPNSKRSRMFGEGEKQRCDNALIFQRLLYLGGG